VPEPLEIPIESNSSKNKTHCADCLALSKTSLTLASDAPNYIVNNSGPLIDMKLLEHSVAIALANNVLPHPGGP